MDQTPYLTLELYPLGAEERSFNESLHLAMIHSVLDCLPFLCGHFHWVSDRRTELINKFISIVLILSVLASDTSQTTEGLEIVSPIILKPGPSIAIAGATLEGISLTDRESCSSVTD